MEAYEPLAARPGQPRFPVERKIKAGFAVALACLLLVGVASYLSIQGLKDSGAWVEHSHQVLGSLESLFAFLTDAETAERGYVITGNASYLQPYSESLRSIEAVQGRLTALTADNATQQSRLLQLRGLIRQRLAQLGLVTELRRTAGFESAQRVIAKDLGKRMHEQIRGAIDAIRLAEQRLLEQRQETVRRRVGITEGVIRGGEFLAFAFVGAAGMAIRRDFLGRERAERDLKTARDELELRVRQRTAQLAQANESLQDSERRFRAFVGATSDAVYRATPDWSQVRQLTADHAPEVNQVWPLTTMHEHIYPDDRAALAAAIAKAIATKTTFELEHRFVRPNDSPAWILSRAVPILDDQGNIVEWFGTASDINARKEAESKARAQLARLALLSDITRAIGERLELKSIYQVVINSLQAHFPLDLCAVCIYDQSANELTVASVGHHDRNLPIELAMTEQSRIPIDANGLSRCVQGRVVYEPDVEHSAFAFPTRLRRGGLRAFVAAPLVVESEVFGIVIAARRASHSFSSGECEFLRQLSEHVALAIKQTQLVDALQRAYDDLRQTQHAVMQQERLLALGKMASGIAHDINNAISPVTLYAESLLEHEKNLSVRTRQCLEIMQRAIGDVAHTVARMRDFYRPREAQTLFGRVDINALVKHAVELTRVRWSDMAQQRGVDIELRSELAPDLPPIMGVESELRDALTNLIFNALDAMPCGGVLTLRTSFDQVVRLEVIDTGVGMDEHTRERCLEPFFTTKGERGTGLGLAMVYGTMQRHSADVEIESEVRKGTTVRLRFSPAAAEAGASQAEATLVRGPQRILLVDDDPIVLKSLEDVLKLDGHDVSTANGGQAGIDAFLAAHGEGHPYRVVITDLGMPYVDGRRVATVIKSTAPKTAVVLLTGWGERLASSQEMPLHVDRILSKPPRLPEVRETLAKLARHQLTENPPSTAIT
jgi:signal transduction histidine kinase/CHASE3 domain sensor protein/ActR/RegA family two-component response regulator